MRTFASLLFAAAVGLGCGLVTSGCQEDTVPTVTLSGSVVDIFSAQPIDGVVLCRLDSPEKDCAVSDDDGRFSLALPLDTENWFTVSHEDYYPFLLAMQTEEADILLPGPVSIGSRVVMEIVLGQTGVDVEPGLGHLLLWVADETGAQGQAGATIDISPDPEGLVVYVNEQGAYSLDATATSSAGAAGYGNIPPGDYILTVTHPELDCEPYSSFSAGAVNTFQLKTIPDHATALFVRCR